MIPQHCLYCTVYSIHVCTVRNRLTAINTHVVQVDDLWYPRHIPGEAGPLPVSWGDYEEGHGHLHRYSKRILVALSLEPFLQKLGNRQVVRICLWTPIQKFKILIWLFNLKFAKSFFNNKFWTICTFWGYPKNVIF